ncbi:hypothetical protein CEXT_142531 [Caerostris extrusa]|uniref:Uncharacterized protein n=1 Tax=Caerostris extrusa TaxID=172846 RepID=A0AAV4ULH8_CAEEX|nr:hypothetical protein CEXT_142531 [Caerostris extrusa]
MRSYHQAAQGYSILKVNFGFGKMFSVRCRATAVQDTDYVDKFHDAHLPSRRTFWDPTHTGTYSEVSADAHLSEIKYAITALPRIPRRLTTHLTLILLLSQ